MLDDVFKALDASTERAVLENLWGGAGLLRSGELTTVLASSDGASPPLESPGRGW